MYAYEHSCEKNMTENAPPPACQEKVWEYTTYSDPDPDQHGSALI